MAVVIFLGSFVLFTRHNDFPYSYHPDESGKTGQVIKGSRNYHHPLLLLSLTVEWILTRRKSVIGT